MEYTCAWCGKEIDQSVEGGTQSSPDGPVHVGECADKLAEAIRDKEQEAYDYARIHES